MGSACTPWVRPIIGVCRCSSARVRTAPRKSPTSRRIRSQASTIWSAWAVSTTSDDVRPKCSQRAAGPTCSATDVVKAITSWCVTFSISSMRATSKPALARSSRAASAGHDAGRGHRVGGRELHVEPGLVAALLGPDPPHLGVGVARNHARVSCSAVTEWPGPPPSTVRANGPDRRTRCATPHHGVLGDRINGRQHAVERLALVAVDVLAGQMRHAARGALETEHQTALQVILRALQLARRERLGFQAAQLADHDVDELRHGVVGAAGVDRGRASVAVGAQAGEHGVGQPALLADVLEQPRTHRAAEHGVERQGDVAVGIAVDEAGRAQTHVALLEVLGAQD